MNSRITTIPSKVLAALFGVLALLVPSFALAAGGEDSIVLKFSNNDYILLGVSAACGLLSIVMAVVLRAKLMARPTGDEKMQEVGGAVREGALAYLAQQLKLMAIFVVLLAVVLFFAYQGSYGVQVALYMAISFVLGVAASYTAGRIGMIMAVNANMRTAAAALTSYKTALETAFQAGGVAGLITVGMGLLGATAIFVLGGEHAMKLLIGFGFGGSLAALFMRVGGGIFTKAADVGADLVGKVEAGIPEDDPRNPATIADNVGDNVGDCAGMAADIFESYEVTLVAAIVLGAATSAIFDQTTWMKLILFALIARGIGIIASIIGIFSVKGSDDINSDPLKSIGRGFYSSAAIAIALTLGAAYFMMGPSSPGGGINTTTLRTPDEGRREEVLAFKKIQAEVAKEKKYSDPTKVTFEDIKGDSRLAALELNTEDSEQFIRQYLTMTPEDLQNEPKKLEGFSKLTLADSANPALKYSIAVPPKGPGEQPSYKNVEDILKEQDANKGSDRKGLQVLSLEITQNQPAPPAEPGKPAPPPKKKTSKIFYGPIDREAANAQIENANKSPQGVAVKILGAYECYYMTNSKGDLAVGIGPELTTKAPFQKPQRSQAGMGLSYYKESASAVKAAMADAQSKPGSTMPQMKQMSYGALVIKSVEWWRFFLCIFFGVGMAFAFERLTDYYVSTHKRPVNEVAEVATAGPAPMIIQGFAYALESSVFSVLAIVVSLTIPLLLFPPADYGGYLLSFYGIALVGLGLLTTTGFILAMDTFGPISDNAQGVFEMSGAGHANPEASKGVQRLDAAGNTTKALTKGFAIATAVVAAVALFHSYVEQAQLTVVGMRIEVPEIFLGLMIGAAAPFLFSAFSINAVGRASFFLINEVRRQFREDPGIMAGTSKPDYGRCVAIVTQAAQTELLGPGILAIALPVAVAFGFAIGKPATTINGVEYNLVGAQALGGFLAGAILSGQLLAVVLANSGGMWDNAKKLIEDGMHGGKGTEAHKAGVVCDTVGDPFKDTAGPALNPLIKVMNLVGLLLAPFIIKNYSLAVQASITIGALILLTIAFVWSKRGSMSSGLSAAKNEPSSSGPTVS